MKIAFFVLLIAAVVFAKFDHTPGVKHTLAHHPVLKDEPDCEVGEDCEDLCNWQCYNSVAALCIDGSCYCEVEELDTKKK